MFFLSNYKKNKVNFNINLDRVIKPNTEDFKIGLRTSKNNVYIKPFLPEFTPSPKKQKEIKYADGIINLKSIEMKATHRGSVPQHSKIKQNNYLGLNINIDPYYNGPYSNPLLRSGNLIDSSEIKSVPLILPNIKPHSDKFKRY